jgi:hypothetical protein
MSGSTDHARLPKETRTPLLHRPSDLNGGMAPTMSMQDRQIIQPSFMRNENASVANVVQDSSFVSQRLQPDVCMPVPGFHPGTYGLSYYQNFPPLLNPTQQHF